MGYHIERCLTIAREKNMKDKIGMLLRLKGLNKVMSKDYNQAEEILNQSIRVYEEIKEEKDSYNLNIAATYNYLGDIQRGQKKFIQAMEMYNIAINICESNKIIQGKYMFNLNIGTTYFELGNIEESLLNLIKPSNFTINWM